MVTPHHHIGLYALVEGKKKYNHEEVRQYEENAQGATGVKLTN
jgi:hypothetical protein